ncbi:MULTISPECIES: reverse transcriptase family protein [Shewanella]|uniref:reverse transcriptase family protein n=1 Tax=Shewanella TaxID=22 RepID=UPI000F424C1C|nr:MULTISPECIES: reverse transcriptase family protein [Shewanella]AYV14584.1 RNA-directed DNA polymerase [Shewanella algae]NJI83746.1 RNA-directed DNA polymerase [Shewanella sp. Iso12]
MNRWNPNFYYKEGIKRGFNTEYLDKLIEQGRKIQENNIPVLFSLAHLASCSRTQYSELHSFVARTEYGPEGYPYRNFPIRKRSGGKRWISVPAPPLMAVQSWINKNILNSIPTHPTAFAYVNGIKSPLKAHAEKHCDADWVLKVDIKNFFSNISERQVYRVFRSLSYSKLLSFEMARLCTRITPGRTGKRWNIDWNESGVEGYSCTCLGSLPQGAPSSPALSNLVCFELDTQLHELALSRNATYSRYADDLCFSFIKSSRDEVYQFKREVNKALWDNSFTENPKKSHIIPPGARKIVTGLIVNSDKPSIPRELIDAIRMHLFYSEKFGIPAHCRKRGFRSVIGFRNHLKGLIMYVYSIDPKKGNEFLEKYNRLPWLEFEI